MIFSHKLDFSCSKMCNVQHSVHIFFFFVSVPKHYFSDVMNICLCRSPSTAIPSPSLSHSLTRSQNKILYIKYIRKMSVNWKWVKRQFFFSYRCVLAFALLACHVIEALLNWKIFFFLSFFSFCFFESRKFFTWLCSRNFVFFFFCSFNLFVWL
jgi:hypothetical protein